jgi:hypothetical protein
MGGGGHVSGAHQVIVRITGLLSTEDDVKHFPVMNYSKSVVEVAFL